MSKQDNNDNSQSGSPDFVSPRIDPSVSGKLSKKALKRAKFVDDVPYSKLNKSNNNNKDGHTKKQHSDLFIRLSSGAIYAAFILAGSLLGNFASMIMVSILAGVSAYEFYFMLRSDAKLPNEMLGIIGSVAFPISYYFYGVLGCIVVIIVLICALLVWYVSWLHSRIADVCISFFGAIYTGMLLTCLLALRMSVPSGELWGGIFIIFLLTTVTINDGVAYLFGRAFGKHALAPLVSPKKTWEGFLAGSVVSVALWCVLVFFPGINIELWQCILFGVLCAMAGVIGDLVESRIKRNSGVKDSGKIMPGHGGILDRMDSVFLVSLVAAFLLYSSNCISISSVIV